MDIALTAPSASAVTRPYSDLCVGAVSVLPPDPVAQQAPHYTFPVQPPPGPPPLHAHQSPPSGSCAKDGGASKMFNIIAAEIPAVSANRDRV